MFNKESTIQAKVEHLDSLLTANMVVVSVPFQFILPALGPRRLNEDYGYRSYPFCEILLQAEYFNKWFSNFHFWEITKTEQVTINGRLIKFTYVEVDKLGLENWEVSSQMRDWAKCFDRFAENYIKEFR